MGVRPPGLCLANGPPATPAPVQNVTVTSCGVITDPSTCKKTNEVGDVCKPGGGGNGGGHGFGSHSHKWQCDAVVGIVSLQRFVGKGCDSVPLTILYKNGHMYQMGNNTGIEASCQ
jgi:hypothetical protein